MAQAVTSSTGSTGGGGGHGGKAGVKTLTSPAITAPQTLTTTGTAGSNVSDVVHQYLADLLWSDANYVQTLLALAESGMHDPSILHEVLGMMS